MTALITRAECRASNACYSDAELDAFIPAEGIRPSELVSLIGETRAGRTLTPENCHWALCNGVPDPDLYAREYRIHACWCARRALERVTSPDQRSVYAVDVAERFACGNATAHELAAASDAASDASWGASWAASWAAASDAARAASWAAASDAARAASWAAARAAASDAAWAAARAAASDAACAAERLEQCKYLAQILEGA